MCPRAWSPTEVRASASAEAEGAAVRGCGGRGNSHGPANRPCDRRQHARPPPRPARPEAPPRPPQGGDHPLRRPLRGGSGGYELLEHVELVQLHHAVDLLRRRGSSSSHSTRWRRVPTRGISAPGSSSPAATRCGASPIGRASISSSRATPAVSSSPPSTSTPPAARASSPGPGSRARPRRPSSTTSNGGNSRPSGRRLIGQGEAPDEHPGLPLGRARPLHGRLRPGGRGIRPARRVGLGRLLQVLPGSTRRR